MEFIVSPRLPCDSDDLFCFFVSQCKVCCFVNWSLVILYKYIICRNISIKIEVTILCSLLFIIIIIAIIITPGSVVSLG